MALQYTQDRSLFTYFFDKWAIEYSIVYKRKISTANYYSIVCGSNERITHTW